MRDVLYPINTFDQFIKDFDIVISLSVAGEAPLLSNPIEPKDPCLIWTYLHAPAVTLPLQQGPNGLPIGLQFVSSRYNDFFLLNFCDFLMKRYK